jgi:hypothetical protein
MALFLRTFPTQPKLQNRMYGEGREFLQRANLVESETSRAGFVFEFRFNESDGHLPPRSFVPLRLDSFSILREKRKLSDGGEFERLYLGLDPRADFSPLGDKESPTEFGVEAWSDEVTKSQYGERVIYRQQVQLFDLESLSGYPFEISSNDPHAVLKAGQVYHLRAANFQQAAYGGIRIDPRSSFQPWKKAAA